MIITFRCDASIQIGSGHVIRCLTLAKALKKEGADISFICRDHEGNLNGYLEKEGIQVYRLSRPDTSSSYSQKSNVKNTGNHEGWLGASQIEDARECRAIIENLNPDWLIVDHYAIDKTWQLSLAGYYKKLMVIDDLADREHLCDLLLDQTYGRQTNDYNNLVPTECQRLSGAKYALLKPEFSRLRAYSFERRRKPKFDNILVSMGGIDSNNITSTVLHALNHCELHDEAKITVIMGLSAPNVDEVNILAASMRYNTQVKVNVSNMAEVMANSDVAIGAAGTTTWERCCLGLPTIMMVLAKNQEYAASILHKNGVVLLVKPGDAVKTELIKHIRFLENNKSELVILSQNSMNVSDGKGVERVVDSLYGRNV